MQIAFWILKPEGLIIGIYSCYWLTLFSGHANNNPNAISLSSHFVGVPHCLHFLGFLNQLYLKKKGVHTITSFADLSPSHPLSKWLLNSLSCFGQMKQRDRGFLNNYAPTRFVAADS